YLPEVEPGRPIRRVFVRWQWHLPDSRGWRQPAARADAEQEAPEPSVVHAGWQAAGLSRSRGEHPNLDGAVGGPGRPGESREAGAMAQEQLRRRQPCVLARWSMACLSIERIGEK